MPFDISTDPDTVCTLGEGHTPIIDISNYPICNELNLQVYLKDEGQPKAMLVTHFLNMAWPIIWLSP
jgi:hypothetical protein